MKKLLSLFLTCTIACTSFTGIRMTSVSANDNITTNETKFADFRAEALKNAKDVAYSGETRDTSNIIHLPQEYVEMIPYDPNSTSTYTTIEFPEYVVTSTRDFSVRTSNGYVNKTGELLAQNENINLWYITTDSSHQLSKDDIVEMKDSIIEKGMSIYQNMTNDFAKHERVEGLFSNYPLIGDVDNDGRINVLLYDISDDGDDATLYVAGFFSSGDQQYDSNSDVLPIDALHMDIGSEQGGSHLQNETDKSGFYGTFAHEFQHLLFHNHIGWKVSSNETTWINESLSGIADLYYATGEYSEEQTPDIGKFYSSIPNAYDYDFFNFSGMKSYGMGYYLSSFMHTLYKKDYIKDMYNYFQSVKFTNDVEYVYEDNIPVSGYYVYSLQDDKNNSFYEDIKSTERADYDKVINSELFGAAFRNVMGVNNSNETSFEYVYRLFMEAYASDGGSATFSDSNDGTITVDYPKLWADDNLWDYRTGGGKYSGITIEYSELKDGSKISLNGYNMNFADGPTHEMLYEIETGTDEYKFLTIKVGGTTDTDLYTYVVLLDKDDDDTNIGNIYPLNIGVDNIIDTDGKTPYLFATTFYNDVTDAVVTISWSEDGEETTPGGTTDLEYKDYLPTPVISYSDDSDIDNYLKQDDILKVTIFDNDTELTFNADYTAQWYRAKRKDSNEATAMSVTTHNYDKIEGSTAQTYKITSDDVGYQIAVITTPIGETSLENYNIDPIYSVLTDTVGDENSLKPIANITIELDSDDNQLYAKHNSIDFSDTEENFTFQWYKDGQDDDNKITENATNYNYTLPTEDSIGTYYVEITPDGNGSFTDKSVFSSEFVVSEKEQLPTPKIYITVEEVESEVTSAKVDDTLYVKSSDFKASDEKDIAFTNIIFNWYAESKTEPIKTEKVTEGVTSEYKISADDIDAENGDKIYVIAEPDNTLSETYSTSEKSSNVTIEAEEPEDTDTYTISFSGDNVSFEVKVGEDNTVATGAELVADTTYTFTVTADENYTLPESVTIEGVNDYSRSDDKKTATFTITTGDTIESSITITINGVADEEESEKTEYTLSVNSSDENIEEFTTVKVDANTEGYIFTLTPKSGCELPASDSENISSQISIKMGEVDLIYGTQYLYQYENGTATIKIVPAIIADVVVTIADGTATKIEEELETYNVTVEVLDSNITSNVDTQEVNANIGDFSITLTANDGYELPEEATDEITITMGETTLTLNSNYSYKLEDDGTATITILFFSDIDGDIKVSISDGTAKATKEDDDDEKETKHSVNLTLEDSNITTNFDEDTEVDDGGSLTITLTPNSGYELPEITEKITITMGETTLTSGTDFTYSLDSETGKATITIASVTDVVSITIADELATESDNDDDKTKHKVSLTLEDNNITTNFAENTEVNDGGILTITLTPEDGYELPGSTDKITITMGETTLTSGTDFTYSLDSETGKATITITEVTGAVSIEITDGLATEIVDNEDEKFSVTLNLVDKDNVSTNTGAKVTDTKVDNGTYTITITADSGYILSDSVSVKMGETDLNTGVTYSVDDETQIATLTVEGVTDNITITLQVTIKESNEYTISLDLQNISVKDVTDSEITATEQAAYSLTLQANEGYKLPTEITVVDGDDNVVEFTYNNGTGVVVFNLYQNTKITATATQVEEETTEYSVTYDLTGLTSTGSNSDTVKDGDSYEFTLSLIDSTNYTMPKTIDVSYVNTDDSINALVVSNSYTYDPSTGEVVVKVVGQDLKITASATAKDYDVTFNLTNTKTSDGIATDTATYGEKYTVTLVANEGYTLPDTIEITPTTDYSYDSSNGVVTITKITGNIIISCASIKDDLTEEDDNDLTEEDDDDSTEEDDDDSTEEDDDDSTEEDDDDSTEDDDDSTEEDDDSTEEDDDDSTSTNLYSITFIDASGNTVTTISTSSNATLSYIPSLSTSSDSVVFIGWYYNGEKVTTSTVFSSNATVYAKTSTVVNPSQTSTNAYEINTSSTDVAFYVTALQGGTITVNSTSGYIDNLIVLPTDSTDTSTTATNVILPDSKGNTVMWTIPAGAQIDEDNLLNLGVIVSDYTINPYEYSYGRSIGYIDFAHTGNLLENGRSLTLTYQLDQANTADYYRIYKLDDSNNVTSTSVYTYTIGNYYMRADFTSCSKWEVFASNYYYNGNNNNNHNDNLYTVYYNIPTFGYIAEFRNVQLNQVLNLDLIDVNGQTIIGWYYDSALTVPVTNTSYVVVTQAIVDGGLYPKYGSNYVTPETGNPYPDYGNNYTPNFSGNPSTMINKLLQLF